MRENECFSIAVGRPGRGKSALDGNAYATKWNGFVLYFPQNLDLIEFNLKSPKLEPTKVKILGRITSIGGKYLPRLGLDCQFWSSDG